MPDLPHVGSFLLEHGPSCIQLPAVGRNPQPTATARSTEFKQACLAPHSFVSWFVLPRKLGGPVFGRYCPSSARSRGSRKVRCRDPVRLSLSFLPGSALNKLRVLPAHRRRMPNRGPPSQNWPSFVFYVFGLKDRAAFFIFSWILLENTRQRTKRGSRSRRILRSDVTNQCLSFLFFNFRWSLLENREAKLKGEGEVGSS